jgi:hypothetical protein
MSQTGHSTLMRAGGVFFRGGEPLGPHRLTPQQRDAVYQFAGVPHSERWRPEELTDARSGPWPQGGRLAPYRLLPRLSRLLGRLGRRFR